MALRTVSKAADFSVVLRMRKSSHYLRFRWAPRNECQSIMHQRSFCLNFLHRAQPSPTYSPSALSICEPLVLTQTLFTPPWRSKFKSICQHGELLTAAEQLNTKPQSFRRMRILRHEASFHRLEITRPFSPFEASCPIICDRESQTAETRQ